jgi:hypothetical protein
LQEGEAGQRSDLVCSPWKCGAPLEGHHLPQQAEEFSHKKPYANDRNRSAFANVQNPIEFARRPTEFAPSLSHCWPSGNVRPRHLNRRIFDGISVLQLHSGSTRGVSELAGPSLSADGGLHWEVNSPRPRIARYLAVGCRAIRTRSRSMAAPLLQRQKIVGWGPARIDGRDRNATTAPPTGRKGKPRSAYGGFRRNGSL